MHCQINESMDAAPAQSKTILFQDGLYGLEPVKEYELLSIGKQDNPLRWLRSIDGQVCFVVMDPRLVEPEYDFDLSDEAMRKLGATKDTQFVVLSIVVMSEKVEDMTINLKSPLVINSENLKGMQIILDQDKYELKRRLAGS